MKIIDTSITLLLLALATAILAPGLALFLTLCLGGCLLASAILLAAYCVGCPLLLLLWGWRAFSGWLRSKLLAWLQP